GLGAAIAGLGVWALVAGQLAAAAATAVLAWSLVTWPRRGRASWTCLRELSGFGRHVAAGNLLGFVGAYLDNLAVGGLLGSEALGLYGVAFKWGRITPMALGAAVGPVAFPSYVAVSSDERRLRDGYLRVLRIVATVATPLALGLAVTAPGFV